MTKGKLTAVFSVCFLLIGLALFFQRDNGPSQAEQAPVLRPALSVSVIQPEFREIPRTLTANGSIAAWQEAIVGAEVGDLHLSEVRVQVGDKVGKGQVLAIFANESVLADVEQSRAVLAEAEANLAEARLNAVRAQKLSRSGSLSGQQIDKYLTGEKTAQAKVQSAKAQLDSQLLRLKYTKVLAGDDGIISSRTATLGAVVSKGQELFRLIRQNRLEWQGEVTAAEMAQIKPGLPVSVTVPNVGSVNGTVRNLSPALDVRNRNGLVYVELPKAADQGFRAGMFAQGDFRLGGSSGLSIPQDALSLREGFSYVFRLGEASAGQAKVSQVKVELGRRSGDNWEILSGVQSSDRLVASGATFLSDGDIVRIVQP